MLPARMAAKEGVTLLALQDTLESRGAARVLGYYVFWNLRSADSGLGLSEADVKARAGHMGIRNTDSAWQLLDKNGDDEATLEEVVQSVEHVRRRRLRTA